MTTTHYASSSLAKIAEMIATEVLFWFYLSKHIIFSSVILGKTIRFSDANQCLFFTICNFNIIA